MAAAGANGGLSHGGSLAGGGETSFAGEAAGGQASSAGGTQAGSGGAITMGTGGDGSAGDGAAGSANAPACTTTSDCACASFQGHDYWFCKPLLNFVAAEQHCETQSMHLVRIDSAPENDFLVATGTTGGVFVNNGFAQIGANDRAVGGEWRWLDGTLFWQGGSGGTAVGGAFTQWLASSPSSQGAQQCSGLLDTGKWQDRSCTALNSFICEAP